MSRRKKRKTVKKINDTMRKKLVGLFTVVLLSLVGLAMRITYINASNGDKYRRQVLTQSQQQYTSQTLPAKRGDIYDRNGTVLATSNKVYNVILDCKLANAEPEYLEPTVQAMVNILGADETEIRNLLSSEETKSSQYQIIKKAISMDVKKEFEAYASPSEEEQLTEEERKSRENIHGVWFEEDYLRSYPFGSLACDTIGFTVDNNISDWGIEGQYSSILNGVDGRSYGYFNENSDVEHDIISPTNGSSVVSTIDVGVQQIVEKYIQAFMKTMGGKNVAAVVMNPNNGEILGMASQDSYDLNNPNDLTSIYSKKEIEAMSDEEISENLSAMWNNYCVTEAFEPGSVVKPIVMASGLECGAFGEEQHFMCDGGQSFGESVYIKCTGSHGDESLMDVIANSCNDAMMQVGAKMGIEKFTESQSLFNFGTKTGIDLPNEGTGIIHGADTMGPVDLACSAFGQGFTCTMIQETAAMCSVVNGGNYYQPHVVSKILNSDGSVSKVINPTLLKQTISSGISKDVRSYMQASVLYGTSHYSKVEGYSSGGKTGTAEKLPRGNQKYLVSFIGFAPVDNPQIVCYVVVDEPNADRQDNSAYPQYIAQAIMSEVLPYLNVTPDETEGGYVPTTELWQGFAGVSRRTDEDLLEEVDENTTPVSDLTNLADDEEVKESNEALNTDEGSFEGTSDPNIPAPLDEDSNDEQEEAMEAADGVTNEEAEMGW